MLSLVISPLAVWQHEMVWVPLSPLFASLVGGQHLGRTLLALLYFPELHIDCTRQWASKDSIGFWLTTCTAKSFFQCLATCCTDE